MKVEYSKDIDALRIYIREGKFDDTVELAPDLFVDYDEHKNILSIEMLEASRLLNMLRERPAQQPQGQA
ncbi:MAG: DUF2283 domain-containing protein [Candidatus Kapaibacterium sp.]